MVTIEACLLCSRLGIAASTKRTLPIRSTSNPFFQAASSGATASALTLATTMSIPPSAFAAPVAQAFRASPSPTSATLPTILTPCLARSLIARSTSSALRAQKATFTPSAASVSTMARPMPLVPPVTTAFSPFNPRSMLTPDQLVKCWFLRSLAL